MQSAQAFFKIHRQITASDRRPVGLEHLSGGMRQSQGQFPVIGHQQKALRHDVQTADRIKPSGGLWKELPDRPSPLLVMQAAHISAGLVQHVVLLVFSRRNRSAVHKNAVCIRTALPQHRLTAVYRHASGADGFLRRTP